MARAESPSTLSDGASGVTNLGFGGNQGLFSSSQALQRELPEYALLVRRRQQAPHQVQHGAGLTGNSQDQSSNLLGTFAYNSLADLEAGVPAAFTRTLTARRRSTGQVNGAILDRRSWRRTQDLQIQYSVRVDGSRFTATPAYNADVE